MSTAMITIDHNDDTGQVEIFVSGGDDSQARAIAEHIMKIAHQIQGGSAEPYEIELN